MLKGGVKMAKFFIISLVLIPLIFICMVAAGQTTDEKIAFVPVDHTYIYDVNDDGSVRCTWSTTIIPKEPTILYTYSFRGGETKNYLSEDSLGQIIDADVNEENGQRTISLLLAGYPLDKPYQFNLSFDWNGLLTRNGDRHTLYTSVNVGEPQAAGIIVIPPQDSRIGTSVVTKGNSSEPFQRELLSNRNALVWRSDNTGNETEIVFRANYNYYSATMSLMDNFYKILIALAIIIAAALLLGYRKKLPGMASKIKEHI
jgi:hypothetical protein